jgi:hypothetical protein
VNERSVVGAQRGIFRGTLSGDGTPGPIEERFGRRLLRLIDPESDEGLSLLDEGAVDLVGPDGEHLGQLTPREAYDKLLRRLERRLDRCLQDPEQQARREGLRNGLTQVRAWSERMGRT